MPPSQTQTAVAVKPDGPKPAAPKQAAPKPRLVTTPTSAKALPAFARPPKPAAKSPAGQGAGAAARLGVADGASSGLSAGASAGGSAGRIIPMRMPEPPSSLSPAAKARIKATQHAAGAAASANAALKTAKEHKDEAALAVNEPPQQANARAAADLVAELGENIAPSPEIEKLCADIYKAIESQGPADEDSLVKAEPLVESAGGVVNGTVNSNIDSVNDKYATLQKAPVGVPEQGTKIPSPPGVASTSPLNAAQDKPDAIPAKDVSLDADTADSQARMDQAGMSTEPAMLVKSGPIAEAREAQGDLKQVAAEDPAKVLAEQHERLLKAGSDFAGLQHTALTLLQQSRSTTIGHVAGQQHEFIGTDAEKRTAASTEANKIFTTAQNAVNSLLTGLPETARALWKEGVASATSVFKAKIKQVQDWIDDRHSGILGTLISVGDFFSGLPDWVSESYTAAQRAFADEICKTARDISIKVNTIVRACEKLITDAGTQIKGVFSSLKGNLAEWAEGQQREFGDKLTALTKRAHDVRDNFNKELVQDASAAVQDVRETVYKLREKAKSLLGRVIDKVEEFLNDPAKFIIEGLLDLLGISPSAFWAVVAKIKKVIGDIARHPKQFANNLMDAIGKGFSQFFGNIKKHLFEGFIDWLTKGLASAGVTIPRDFSLKSVMTFILELMGITWPRIRKVLAEVAGEKNVALIEKAYSMVSKLIELGPAGIFHLLEQKLNPQNILDMIIHAAVDYLESAVLKSIVVRVAMLFNPVGAIVEAIEAIYRVLKWIFQNAARIFRLIETLANGIADIVAGNISGMANAVENALAGLIRPVIGFLADYFNLGDLPDVISKQIKGLQDMVMSALKTVLVWLVEKGKGLLAAIGIGGKEKGKEQPEQRTPEQMKIDLGKALEAGEALEKNENLTDDEVTEGLGAIKSKYNMVYLRLVVDQTSEEEETTHLEGEINPDGKSSKVKRKAGSVAEFKLTRPSFTLDTLEFIKDAFPDQHRKGINTRLKSGNARRHVVSSKDMAEHYQDTLKGKKWKSAATLLSTKGFADAHVTAAKPLNNPSIVAAAKERHKGFFNYTENLFVGPSRRNSQIGRRLDPENPAWVDNVDEELASHIKKIKREWALTNSFTPTPLDE